MHPPGSLSAALIPPTLGHPAAGRFWLAVALTGAGTGLAAAALTRLLEVVQRLVWPYEARLTDEEVAARLRMREQHPGEGS